MVHGRQPGRRRLRWTLVGVAPLLATAACGTGSAGYACTTVGGSSSLEVSVQPAIRSRLDALSVELCQAQRCQRVRFPSTPPDPPSTYVRTGVYLDRDTYAVALDALGRGWEPGTATRATVRGVAADGTTVVRHAESFVFAERYPNGEECPPTVLTHTVRVGERDRVE